MNYEGKGSFWPNKYFEEGSKKPKWTGEWTAHRDIQKGEKIPLSMWPNERKNENSPVLRVDVDTYKESKQKPEGRSQDATPFDDTTDVPF